MQQSSKEQGVCTERPFECSAAFKRRSSPPIQLGLGELYKISEVLKDYS